MNLKQLNLLRLWIIALVDESRKWPREETQKWREDRVNKAWEDLENYTKTWCDR